jgi:predicted transcriptional regulator
MGYRAFTVTSNIENAEEELNKKLEEIQNKYQWLDLQVKATYLQEVPSITPEGILYTILVNVVGEIENQF